MSYRDKLISICDNHNCTYEFDVPMKAHTTFRVGGKCKVMVFVNGTSVVQSLLELFNAEKACYTVLGNGSNIIADDEGFNGVVLLFGEDFSEIKTDSNKDYIECNAGASLASVCKFALENSLTGLEFAWGIPGTVGGALYMNAGAYGGEMSDVVISAEYIDENNELKTVTKEEMNLAYRHSIFSDTRKIITKVTVALKQGEQEKIKGRMNELMTRRKDKQPLEYPSAGSTFKRPEGSYASLLIEQCGLKGTAVGGAEVSKKHSGFIINKDNATSKDILELSKLVIKNVQEKTGFVLELEPKILK